jgi:hypothetical protein
MNRNRNRALWVVQGLLAAPTALLGLLAGIVAYGRRPRVPLVGTTRPALRLAHESSV